MRSRPFLFLGMLLTACAPQTPMFGTKAESFSPAPLSHSETSNKIAAKVNRNWFTPYDPSEQKPVTVAIKLDKEGNLVALTVIQSSGNKDFDNSLIRAIRKSMPLPIPPEKISDYSDFEMSFSQ